MHKLLITIGLCFIIDKVHYLFNGDAEWYAYSIGLMAQQLVISIALFIHIEYDDLGIKWLAFIICSAPIIEMALFFTESPWWLGIASILSVSWLAWASYRRYSVESDTLSDDYIYTIAKRPNSLITFLASAFGGPFGRYSYYLKGDVYHYHRNQFKKTHVNNFRTKGAAIMRTEIRATERAKDRLDGMIGQKWGIFHNCLTVNIGERYG